MKFNHVGIPTQHRFDGEIPLQHLQVTVSDHLLNPFGIQWQRYWDGVPYPELVKTVAHVAFEVDDLLAALRGHQVIIEPNCRSRVTVTFIEVNGAPVELMQIDQQARPRSVTRISGMSTVAVSQRRRLSDFRCGPKGCSADRSVLRSCAGQSRTQTGHH